MPIDRIVAPLLRVPLFAGLKPLQLTEIARQAERMRFSEGDVITRAGEPGDGAYLIVSGPAERTDPADGDAPQAIEAGSLIGELAMLIEHDYRATVVARGRVLCLKITRAALREQMIEDPSLARQLERRVTNRLVDVAADLRQIENALAALWPDGHQVRLTEEQPDVAPSHPIVATERKAPDPGGGVGRESA